MSHKESESPRRGRLWRYSLRTLLVLVTLLAVILAYSVSRFARERAAVERLLARRATVVYHDRSYGRVHPERTLAAWIREFAGWRWPSEVYLEGRGVDDGVIRDDVVPLRTLGVVGLTETTVTNEGLCQLAVLPDLRIAGLRSDARNEPIVRELGQPTHIDFQLTPLEIGVEYLIDLHGIPIAIDKSAVPTEQWDRRSQFTATIKNQPLGNALDALLAPHELGWIVKGGKLIITTREVQDEHRALVERMSAKMPQVKVLSID